LIRDQVLINVGAYGHKIFKLETVQNQEDYTIKTNVKPLLRIALI